MHIGQGGGVTGARAVSGAGMPREETRLFLAEKNKEVEGAIKEYKALIQTPRTDSDASVKTVVKEEPPSTTRPILNSVDKNLTRTVKHEGVSKELMDVQARILKRRAQSRTDTIERTLEGGGL